MAEQNSIAERVEKSSSTDVRILLQAKEDAKRALLEDPTNPALITAFEKSSKLLGAAMQEQQKLKSVPEVLAYVGECGRKLGRAKLYKDIQEARLKRQPDGSFRQKDVDRYMLSLATLGTPDGLTEKVADRQRRKEEADIRRAEAAAAKERIISQAKNEASIEAQKQLDEAKRQIQLEKEAAVREVRSQIALLSVGIAEKVLRNKLDDAPSQMSMINRMLDEMPDTKQS